LQVQLLLMLLKVVGGSLEQRLEELQLGQKLFRMLLTSCKLVPHFCKSVSLRLQRLMQCLHCLLLTEQLRRILHCYATL